jgi:hypothetical protein
MVKYAGSFAQGFIEAFQNAQKAMKRRYYQMLQQRLEFQMRQAGYNPDANDGKGGWYSYAHNDFSATSPQQSQREQCSGSTKICRTFVLSFTPELIRHNVCA